MAINRADIIIQNKVAIDYSEPLNSLDMVRCFEPVPAKRSVIQRLIQRVNGRRAAELKYRQTNEDVAKILADARENRENGTSNGENDENSIIAWVENFVPYDQMDFVRCFPHVPEPPSCFQFFKNSIKRRTRQLITFNPKSFGIK